MNILKWLGFSFLRYGVLPCTAILAISMLVKNNQAVWASLTLIYYPEIGTWLDKKMKECF